MLLMSQVINVAFYNWAWKVRQILLRGSNFGLRFFYVSLIYYTDPQLYFPSEGTQTQYFYALKNPSTTDGFEPVNLGSSGEHDNHGNTGVDVPDNMHSCQPQSNILKVKEMYINSKEIP